MVDRGQGAVIEGGAARDADAPPSELMLGIGGGLLLDLSRICAAPSARLGHLAFEGQGAFASQC